ncbi:hypothetical protein BDV96DRAFT_591658 [Lophiotrema nucula]|uniref:WD40-repeat-containing domain protein n=1 Tax=Lophiotrema nucula TaxID=690887 RepID=A0A6A5YFU4_9PLEO|nr:hypothetical protein BDV96DRAFT_591658 [Lophiotrema nucula]
MLADNTLLSSLLTTLCSEAVAFGNAFPHTVSLRVCRCIPAPETPQSHKVQPSTPVSSPASPSWSVNQSPMWCANTSESASPRPIQNTTTPPLISQPPTPMSVIEIPNNHRLQNEIRAYQYPGPVELPARKPTHRPEQPTMRSFQIDTGLQVVEESDSERTRGVSLPPPDLRRLSLRLETDDRSLSNLSSIGTVSSKRKSRLFGGFGRSAKPSMPPLPDSLEFCFSNGAQQVLIWCRKNPDSIVRLRQPFQEAERFEIQISSQLAPNSNKQLTCSIRLVAAARGSAVGVVHIAETRWLYIAHEKAFKPLVAIDNTTPAIHCMSLSHDGNTIALGCGHVILVYKLSTERVTGPWKLYPNVDLRSRVVRLQRVSFSPDSRKLVSAIQVEHNTHKHAIFVSVWGSVDNEFRLEAQLEPVHVTVGYSDDTGITSIFLTGHSDFIASQQTFLTAALSKSYPSILPLAPGLRNQHLDIADKRIDNAAQCPSPTSPYLVAFRSGRNKIYVVDVRSGTMDKVADLSAERKGLQLRHEQVALGMPDGDSIRALWRSADDNLILKTIVKGADAKWTASATELGVVYRQVVGLL